MDARNTYQERQSVVNVAEQMFEEFCALQKLHFYRIGFDEKNGYVNRFPNLNPILRNLPDYFLLTDHKSYVVQIKGSNAIKKSEYEMMPMMLKVFSSEKAPLYYGFFARNLKPKFLKAEKVMEMYEKEDFEDKWSDGVIHKRLPIWE